MPEVNRHGEIVSFSTAQLSARQRSEQMDVTIAQVQALTEHANQATEVLRAHETRINENEVIARAARNAGVEFLTRPFMARLRWLFLGR